MTRRAALLTSLAILAFAANSLLCRAALRPGLVDGVSFTAVRLVSGATVLTLLAWRSGRSRGGSWASALALLAYALPFSLAYLRLDAGAGALVLFGAVQVTMIGWGLVSGHRPGALEGLGLLVSVGGLAVLGAPGLTAPDPLGTLLMAAAGTAWGAYSLRGRSAASPLEVNADNFTRTVPVVLLVVAASAIFSGRLHATPKGLLLAVLSGAVTSGLGYAVWYAALRVLTPTTAASVQLAVPIVAAAGGVLVLGERLTPRLAAAGALVLGGIALVLLMRRRGEEASPASAAPGSAS